jgi:serine/threonine protein kinase
MKTVLFVTFIWTLGRMLHGVLYLLILIGINIIDEISNFSYDTILIVIDLMITELLCYFFILDYSFFRIFTNDFIDSPMNSYLIVKNEISLQDPFGTTSPNIISTLSNESSPDHKLGVLHIAETESSKIVIRKISLPRINKYVLEKIQTDIDYIQSLDIKFIANYKYCNIKNFDIDLSMEFFPFGSLYEILHIKKIHLKMIKKIDLARGISSVMAKAHSMGVVHGHLSSSNILLTDAFEPFVSDFGLKHLKKYCGLVADYCNKSAWSSPEILKDPSNVVTKADSSDDVYSFGIILWELTFEQQPYHGCSLVKLREMVEQEYRPAILHYKIPGISELIKSCWNKNPNHRPDFELITKELNTIRKLLE